MTTVEKTCSCFGHSDVDITDELTARTRIGIDKAIEDGVRIFISENDSGGSKTQ